MGSGDRQSSILCFCKAAHFVLQKIGMAINLDDAIKKRDAIFA